MNHFLTLLVGLAVLAASYLMPANQFVFYWQIIAWGAAAANVILTLLAFLEWERK